MDEQLDNSINFLRSAYFYAKNSSDGTVRIDSETIKMLLDSLKEQKETIDKLLFQIGKQAWLVGGSNF